MASSNLLRPQNRCHEDPPGILKNQDLKTKLLASPLERGSENLDPNISAESGKGVGKLKGVSRLPVLAKSLPLALIELSQNPSHNRWEQRPLTGKAQKKKPCTKPVPFNLSQSRTHSQRNTDVPQGKAPLPPSVRLTPAAKGRNFNPSAKTETSSHKPTTPGLLRAPANKSQRLQSGARVEYMTPNTDSDDHLPSHESEHFKADLTSRLGSISLAQSNLPQDSSLSHLCKTSLLKVDVKDKHCFQTVPSAVQSHVSTKGSSNLPSAVHSVVRCEGSTAGVQCMPRLSTCPPGPGTSNNVPQRVMKKSHRGVEGPTDKAGTFSPDPSALRSILQSDGTKSGEYVGATPRVSTCPTGRGTSIYSAQRVPVKKSQTDDSAAIKAPAGVAVLFSPDPAALRSILLNEGVKAGGATPRVSTCLTGRGTSIYSAQRVPVKKNKPEVTAAASQCANRTPVMKWTPQRVTNTRPQSLRKLCTTQKMSSLRGSPGLRGSNEPSTGLLCQGEDVVQRLFEDQEQMVDDQLLNCHQTTETQSTIKEKIQSNCCQTENEGKKTAQPFIQAAHRGSVIVFSSSQRLVAERSQDTLGATLGTGVSQQPSDDHPTSHNVLPDQSNGSQIKPSLDLTKQSQSKESSIQSTAVTALRRRHTPLEEMFLDEECATYTSRLLSCPLQPRSGNPVATTLLFQDSTCFLPIGLSSPLRLSPIPFGSSIRA